MTFHHFTVLLLLGGPHHRVRVQVLCFAPAGPLTSLSEGSDDLCTNIYLVLKLETVAGTRQNLFTTNGSNSTFSETDINLAAAGNRWLFEFKS